jgi:hypothetical protein
MRASWILGASLAIALSGACQAQPFEIGAMAGYGWDHDASIENPSGSVEAGFKPGFAGGVLFGDDMYQHIGGEIRWLYQAGGPQLTAPGTKVSASGFTNLVCYDLLVHMAPREDRIRPYIAGGAGIKVFTGPDLPALGQPLGDFAAIARGNHVEPLISVGAGVKYRVGRGVQLRLDLHTYLSPCPAELFRVAYPSAIHGWIYDFLPTLGVSYVF